MDVGERRALVLRAIVEEHIRTAQPVGSQTVADRGLGVSSATVRNDMTQLEREGYLTQPHTSAGRIPTDRGYRFFVDHLAEDSRSLVPAQRRAVSEFFRTAHSALEDLLHETSGLLARVTRHASVVVGPQPDVARVRSVQLVGLQPGQALAVVVLSNGAVEKEMIVVPVDVDDERLARASAALGAALEGATLTAPPVPNATGDPGTDELVTAAHDALRARFAQAHELVYVGGASRIAAEHDAFATAERAARLLEMLEEQVVVVSLVRDLLDAGVTVSIGSENQVDELRDCSLVLAPYRVEGQLAGTVGVLGPTRMDYPTALAAVAAVSQQLNRLLSPT